MAEHPTQPHGHKAIVCVGEIAAPHGVKGGLRIRSFTDPAARLFSYDVRDERGQPLQLTERGQDPKPDMLLASLAGVRTREAADALRGTKLYVDRAALPETTTDQYYLSDLEGLEVRDTDGQRQGRILATHDFGAGLLLEIKPAKGATFMLPFTDSFVPRVRLSEGFAEIVLPQEVTLPPEVAAELQANEEDE